MSQRKSIDLRGFTHRNPIPAACRLGPLLMSGSILPRYADGTSPATLDEQCALMFPDSATRPARHTETKDLPGNILVQCDIVAMIAE